MSAAAEVPAAMPMSRCSVETKSSPSAVASCFAAASNAVVAREACGCATEVPDTVGIVPIAPLTARRMAARSAPTASSKAFAIPDSWSSKASKMCVGSMFVCPPVEAASIAAAIASCDLVVSLSTRLLR
jgi:hypothetical protein